MQHLLACNSGIARTNVRISEEWVGQHAWACRWTRKTAFVRFGREGRAVDDVLFCERVQEETRVMLVLGTYAFGRWKG